MRMYGADDIRLKSFFLADKGFLSLSRYVSTSRLKNYLTKAYPETCQTSKIERFPKIVNGSQSLTLMAKHFIFDVWKGS